MPIIPKLLTWLALVCGLPVALQAARITGTFALDLPADFTVTGDADVARLESARATALPSIESHRAQRSHPKWVRLDLEGTAPAATGPRYLRVLAAAHPRVEGHLVAQGRIVESVTAGYAVPSSLRRHHPTKLLLVLPPDPGLRMVVYLRIESDYRNVLRPEILSDNELSFESDSELALVCAYLGSILILLIFQGFLFFHLKDKAARDYSFCSIGLGALALVHSGHFDLLFGDLLGGFLLGDWRIEIRIVNCLLGFLAISSFFEFRTTAPALHRASRGAILIVAGVLLSTTLAPVKLHDAMTAVVQIFSTVTIAAVLGVALRKRLVGSVALALAWGPIVLFTLYLASTRLGVLNIFESSKWTTLVPIATLGWQGLLSTLALSDKIRRLAELRHQKELRDLEAAGLERMVRVLCHDVSTPLATIGMTTDLIELNQQAGKPVDIATANNRLRGAFQAIKEIVDGARQVELLKLSGPDLAREPVDLCAAFADAERMLQEKLKRKRLTVRRSAWPETAIVLAEPRMLRLSVIANALSNAIKFSHAGGVIDVSITREAGETILRIRDHGVGIPAELREMFNRSGRITSREGTMSEEGTGLGVILMRDFVEAMGGSLRLESRTDEESPSDHGTSVELRLRAPASVD